MRLHWSLVCFPIDHFCFTSIRNWKVAAPLKPSLLLCLRIQLPPIRNWKVAAPLKPECRNVIRDINTGNPQLKSCGSIEADNNPTSPTPLQFNPQLKSCGSIEARHDISSTIDYLCNPQLKSCGSIEAHIVRWSASFGYSSIRNWKVAAPLKQKIKRVWKLLVSGNPQLKSCGSIEANRNLSIAWILASNPQLKSCGSIEADKSDHCGQCHQTIRNWKVAAPLKQCEEFVLQ